MTLRIRLETPSDHAQVRSVNERAFGRRDEAEVIDALRRLAEPLISLVAEQDRTVIGHILFSPVRVQRETGDRATANVYGLGPMAVLPERQNAGVGARLVRAGLETCRERGVKAVVVLGHREYYPKFDFQPAAQYGLHYRSHDFDEVFFALELRANSLRNVSGWVRYLPPFEAV